jgi:hypothetical protein
VAENFVFLTEALFGAAGWLASCDSQSDIVLSECVSYSTALTISLTKGLPCRRFVLGGWLRAGCATLHKLRRQNRAL